MHYKKFNLLRKRTSTKEDPDCLVDYEEPTRMPKRRLSKESLARQLDKCKKMMIKSDECDNPHYNYNLEYTEKGKIKRPTYFVQSTGDIYALPITMDVIRSLVLKQHCKITKPEEIVWFEDGLKWLSQQQYQHSYSSNNSSSTTCPYTYYIEEEGNYYQEKKKASQIKDMEELERACEAYFGIPLGLCENSWAAEYLIAQASKGKLLKRVSLKPAMKKFSFSLKRFCCCI